MNDDTTPTAARDLPEDVQTRIDEAAAVEAEAKAAKAAADARAAEATALAAERTGENYDPDLANSEAEATSKKNKATADLEAAKARREQLGAMIPDLSKADRGSLTTSDGTPPMGGSALTYRAIAAAATEIVDGLTLTSAGAENGQDEGQPNPLVLVTTEIDLAGLDATHHEVMTGLQELIDSITQLPPATETERPQTESMTAAIDLAAGIAGAIPGVLSLLSTRRTVSGSMSEANHTAAAAAVVGKLTEKARVVHDNFRGVPVGRVYAKLRELNERRNDLTAKHVVQAQAIETLTGADNALSAEVTRLKAAIAKAKENQGPIDELEAELTTAQETKDWTTNTLVTARALLAKVEALAEAGDSFCAAIRVAGTAGRTPLSIAALYEQLQAPQAAPSAAGDQGDQGDEGQEDAGASESVPAPERFAYVLFVRAETGETHQSTEDKPFFMKDRFATFAIGVITYLLLDVSTGTIVAGGTVSKTASAHGKFGEKVEFRQ